MTHFAETIINSTRLSFQFSQAGAASPKQITLDQLPPSSTAKILSSEGIIPNKSPISGLNSAEIIANLKQSFASLRYPDDTNTSNKLSRIESLVKGGNFQSYFQAISSISSSSPFSHKPTDHFYEAYALVKRSDIPAVNLGAVFDEEFRTFLSKKIGHDLGIYPYKGIAEFYDLYKSPKFDSNETLKVLTPLRRFLSGEYPDLKFAYTILNGRSTITPEDRAFEIYKKADLLEVSYQLKPNSPDELLQIEKLSASQVAFLKEPDTKKTWDLLRRLDPNIYNDINQQSELRSELLKPGKFDVASTLKDLRNYGNDNDIVDLSNLLLNFQLPLLPKVIAQINTLKPIKGQIPELITNKELFSNVNSIFNQLTDPEAKAQVIFEVLATLFKKNNK
jgi:hypothetical protein